MKKDNLGLAGHLENDHNCQLSRFNHKLLLGLLLDPLRRELKPLPAILAYYAKVLEHYILKCYIASLDPLSPLKLLDISKIFGIFLPYEQK